MVIAIDIYSDLNWKLLYNIMDISKWHLEKRNASDYIVKGFDTMTRMLSISILALLLSWANSQADETSIIYLSERTGNNFYPQYLIAQKNKITSIPKGKAVKRVNPQYDTNHYIWDSGCGKVDVTISYPGKWKIVKSKDSPTNSKYYSNNISGSSRNKKRAREAAREAMKRLCIKRNPRTLYKKSGAIDEYRLTCWKQARVVILVKPRGNWVVEYNGPFIKGNIAKGKSGGLNAAKSAARHLCEKGKKVYEIND